MVKQLHLKISGDVVGVFFRASARDQAVALGLTGWVKNANSGVEMLAQGEEERLQEFLQWCKQGPRSAKVEEVEVDWQEAHEKVKRFEIR